MQASYRRSPALCSSRFPGEGGGGSPGPCRVHREACLKRLERTRRVLSRRCVTEGLKGTGSARQEMLVVPAIGVSGDPISGDENPCMTPLSLVAPSAACKRKGYEWFAFGRPNATAQTWSSRCRASRHSKSISSLSTDCEEWAAMERRMGGSSGRSGAISTGADLLQTPDTASSSTGKSGPPPKSGGHGGFVDSWTLLCLPLATTVIRARCQVMPAQKCIILWLPIGSRPS
jgi:hypothetical protein